MDPSSQHQPVGPRDQQIYFSTAVDGGSPRGGGIECEDNMQEQSDCMKGNRVAEQFLVVWLNSRKAWPAEPIQTMQ